VTRSKCWVEVVAHAKRRPWLSLLLIGYWLTDRREVIDADLAQWCRRQYRTSGIPASELLAFGNVREFRNVFYYRLRSGNLPGRLAGIVLSRLLRPLASMDIATEDIGPGFVVTHGYGTIISAASIGCNFWVHQGVTVGYDYGRGNPIIGDDVFIGVGAAVLGGIRIGDGVRVGANAVVVEDVASGATIVGVPGRPIGPRKAETDDYSG
jgi:serine O-acetyltransferase